MKHGQEPLAAMVLAAGRGERMRPLSDVLPKPALPVLDRPLVGWALDQALRAGADSLTVNVWHLAERMVEAVRAAAPGPVEVKISREPELLGGAGGLAAARDRGLLGDRGPVLVLNGDGILELDLEPLLKRHPAQDDLVTLALLRHPDPRRWSRVQLDPSGRVTAISPPGGAGEDGEGFLYPGAMLVAREALDRLPTGAAEVADLLWEPARRAGRLGGAAVSGRWREVGTPEDYRTAIMDRLAGTSWVHGAARLAADARVEHSMIGRGVVVDRAAQVIDSVLADGAVVSAGCRVEGSVLLGPVRLPPGETLEHAVLAAFSPHRT